MNIVTHRSRSDRRGRRANLSLVLALTMAGLLTLFVALPASAHSELLASVPENGSTVSEVSEVSLTFGEEIVGEYTTLSLANESDEPIELNAPTMDATSVMCRLVLRRSHPTLRTTGGVCLAMVVSFSQPL